MTTFTTTVLGDSEAEVAAYIGQTEGCLLEVARRRALAEGRTFDPADPNVRAWVDGQVAEALDDLGHVNPDRDAATRSVSDPVR